MKSHASLQRQLANSKLCQKFKQYSFQSIHNHMNILKICSIVHLHNTWLMILYLKKLKDIQFDSISFHQQSVGQ